MKMKSIIIITDDEKRAIRENVNYTSEEQIQQDIDTVLEWFKKQQHLPRIDLDRRFIESYLISRKGSVEQAKQKIDMMYSLRTVIPDLAFTRDVLHPRIQTAIKSCTYVAMPKLNHDMTRINIFTFKGDVDCFNAYDCCNYMFALTEYRLLNDYFAGERYIMDLKDISLGHITKFTPTVVKYCELYMQKAYGLRIFGIHFVNTTGLLNTFLSIFKAGLSEKLKSRIYIHTTMEDMYKFIDKDKLPAEYGGDDRSMTEIMEDWNKELASDETRKYLKEQENLRSNEALRIGGNLDDDILGVAGTFRKLEVD